MSIGVKAALETMKLKERELESLAHNLANANTAGFKEENLRFEADLSKALGKDAGTYMPKAEKIYDFSQGALFETNNPYDVALQGKGFLEVQTDQGTFYTRNGAMTLDAQGNLVTVNGAKIVGEAGPITIDKDGKLDISSSGELSVNGEQIAKLKVVDFEDKSKISSIGANLYQADSSAQAQVVPNPTVIQGKQEASNVNTVKNMARLIEVNRQYEAYQRVLKTQDKMNEEAPTTLGRLA